MKKKQAMKLIASAGAAIGGAYMFQDGNMVYAAEVDQGEDGELIFPAEEQESTGTVDSTEQISSDVTIDNGTTVESTVVTDSAASTENSVATENTSTTEDEATTDSTTMADSAEIVESTTTTDNEEEVNSGSENASAESSESMIDSEEISLGSEESVFGSEESASGSEESAFGSEESASGSEESAFGSEESASGSEESASGSEESTSESEGSVSESEESEFPSEKEDESGSFTSAELVILRRAQAKLAAGIKLTEEEQALIDRSTSESAAWSQTYSERASESMAASEFASNRLSEEFETSASESLQLSESLSAFQSTANSLDMATSESVSNANSEYDSALDKLNGKQEWLDELTKLKEDITKQQELVEQELDKSDHYWWGGEKDTVVNSYWKAADKLAELLIRFKAYTDATVNHYRDITIYEWVKDGTTKNYVKVEYTDVNGNKYTKYYDYVTGDKNGNPINSNNKNKIGSIIVIELPVDKDGNPILGIEDGNMKSTLSP